MNIYNDQILYYGIYGDLRCENYDTGRGKFTKLKLEKERSRANRSAPQKTAFTRYNQNNILDPGYTTLSD